jgi:activator of HSP90 ATPase
MSQHIHQEVEFNASPSRVYATLTDAARFSALTGGAPAEISREAGGAFSCFGGAIVGRQIELAPDQRVVQAWRAGNWPAGAYSIVRFELQAAGDGTRLIFDQSGFPEAESTHLADGWHKMYWEPMRKYLA